MNDIQPASVVTTILFNHSNDIDMTTSCSLTVNKTNNDYQRVEFLFPNCQSAFRFRSCAGGGKEQQLVYSMRDVTKKIIKQLNHGQFVMCVAMICGLDLELSSDNFQFFAREIANSRPLSKAVGLGISAGAPWSAFRTSTRLQYQNESRVYSNSFYRWFVRSQTFADEATTPTMEEGEIPSDNDDNDPSTPSLLASPSPPAPPPPTVERPAAAIDFSELEKSVVAALSRPKKRVRFAEAEDPEQ